MKEVIKVSISGIAFVFTQEAYGEMARYLDKLGKDYSGYADGKEIMDDIEARVVELILMEQTGDQVVEKGLVEKIITQLGYPEENSDRENPRPEEEEPVGKLTKRLYRNPDGAKLGGVCNGIASYFGIDVSLVRLCFLLPLILRIGFIPMRVNGTFISSLMDVILLLYFVLWIIIPVARSPRQKLEMKGKKVTASSIRETAQQESRIMSSDTGNSASILANIFIVLGKIFIVFLKIIAIIIAFAFTIGAVSIIACLAVLIIDSSLLSSETYELLAGLHGISVEGYVGLILSVILIPFIIIVYTLGGAIFKYKVNRAFTLIISGCWLLITIYAGIITLQNRDNFNVEIFSDWKNDYHPRVEWIVPADPSSPEPSLVVINGDTIVMNGTSSLPQLEVDNKDTVKDDPENESDSDQTEE